MGKKELTFQVEKETKNTVRFKEVNPPEHQVIGTLYVQKSVIQEMGNPKELTLTIEAKG